MSGPLNEPPPRTSSKLRSADTAQAPASILSGHSRSTPSGARVRHPAKIPSDARLRMRESDLASSIPLRQLPVDVQTQVVGRLDQQEPVLRFVREYLEAWVIRGDGTVLTGDREGLVGVDLLRVRRIVADPASVFVALLADRNMRALLRGARVRHHVAVVGVAEAPDRRGHDPCP